MMASSLPVLSPPSPTSTGYSGFPPRDRYTFPVPVPAPYSSIPCTRSGSAFAPPRRQIAPASSRKYPVSYSTAFRLASWDRQQPRRPVSAPWNRASWQRAEYYELYRRSRGGRTPPVTDLEELIVSVSHNLHKCACNFISDFFVHVSITIPCIANYNFIEIN